MRREIISNLNLAQSLARSDSDVIPGTGWTYFDAAAMSDELNREERLFPRHRRPASFLSHSFFQRSDIFKAEFLRRTGWSWDDAVAEARINRREMRPSRLFL